MQDNPSTSNIVSLDGRRVRPTQAKRRATVRAALLDTRRWLDAGLDGSISLEEATASAGCALRPAEREVLRAALA